MVWHIHMKNGKFAVWSTVVDAYVTPWGSEQEIRLFYISKRLNDAAKEIVERIDEMIEESKQNNGCSVPYLNLRCDNV